MHHGVSDAERCRDSRGRRVADVVLVCWKRCWFISLFLCLCELVSLSFHSDLREMSNMQNMNSGVLPNQYLSHQNLPQLPQQYPYQQVGGCFSWFEWVAGNAKRSGGFKLASGSVLAGRFAGVGGRKECERSTPRAPHGSHQKDHEDGRLGSAVRRAIGLVAS